MNRLKDFFYNKNDIIIVLIIILAAGFIIYTRIDAIMEYPEKLADQTAQEQKAEATEDAAVEDAEGEKSEKAEAGNGDKEKNGEAGGAASKKPVSITITDADTSIDVAEKLYKAGLVDSDIEFENYVANKNKSSSLISGTFDIPKGSSYEEILNIIAN